MGAVPWEAMNAIPSWPRLYCRRSRGCNVLTTTSPFEQRVFAMIPHGATPVSTTMRIGAWSDSMRPETHKRQRVGASWHR